MRFNFKIKTKSEVRYLENICNIICRSGRISAPINPMRHQGRNSTLRQDKLVINLSIDARNRIYDISPYDLDLASVILWNNDMNNDMDKIWTMLSKTKI